MTTTIYKRFTDEGLTLDSEIERLTARVKELEQQVERYRAALVKIRSPHESDPPPDVIARTALKDEK